MDDSPSVPPELRDAIAHAIVEGYDLDVMKTWEFNEEAAAAAVCAVIEAHLEPWGDWCEIRNADGSMHCNHSDTDSCSRTDHVRLPVFRWRPSPRKDGRDG